MSRLVWTLPALAAVTLLTSGVEAQNNEERAVIAAAQAVFDAMEALDPEAFRNAMVPDGFLMAVRSETTRRTTRDDFAANIARQTRPMTAPSAWCWSTTDCSPSVRQRPRPTPDTTN